jgi:hypothetical protein
VHLDPQDEAAAGFLGVAVVDAAAAAKIGAAAAASLGAIATESPLV